MTWKRLEISELPKYALGQSNENHDNQHGNFLLVNLLISDFEIMGHITGNQNHTLCKKLYP